MTMTSVHLVQRPDGMVKDSDFEVRKGDAPTPGPGEVLVKVSHISLDPAMRGWMNEGKSYIPPVGIGEIMRAGAVGEVVASHDESFAPGDWVSGTLGVTTHAVVQGKDLVKIDTSLAPPERYLSALGMPGMTAYFGILDVGDIKAGETVVVSAASGAVGALVCQIAKIKGCRVVGIAGGPEKCAYLTDEIGCDAAIDYKSENVLKAMADACPKGVDVYFDNVGGDILEAAMTLLARRARVVICGAIAGYNDFAAIRGPRNYLNLLVQHARMEGFVVFDYHDRYAEGIKDMAKWLSEGKMTAKEDIRDGGVERYVEVLNMLFTGENFGKLVLKA
ncbi:MAG: NADP-dependent oxidoreductase [Pseudomonadota bacterium]